MEQSICLSPSIIESTPEKIEADAKQKTSKMEKNSKPSTSENHEDNLKSNTSDKFEDGVKPNSSEKLENDFKPSNDKYLDEKDNTDKLESLGDVKFLPVHQFRLNIDNERSMCIKQQKNSWLQLNDSKKDFQSVVDKSSVAGPLSILKRDREELKGEKRVKRKIYDYFSPKN